MQDGFLSPQIEDWRLGVCASMREWVVLVGRVSNTALGIMQTVAPERTSDRELIAAALYARAIQSFQASVILAERGMLADAETLGRSVVETALFLGGLANIPDFHKEMVAANNQHYASMANGISTMLRESTDTEDKMAAEDLDKLVKGVKAQAQSFQFQPINMKVLADRAGMQKLYQVVYRRLSGDAAHPTIASIQRHFSRIDGSVEKLTFSPQRAGVEEALSESITAVMFAMEAACKIFNLNEAAAGLEALTTAHVQLKDRLKWV